VARLYFDVRKENGTVEHDLTGVIVSDKGTALQDCIEFFCELQPDQHPVSLTVRDEDGDVLMVLHVEALLKSS
jgi:hypothetical protein